MRLSMFFSFFIQAIYHGALLIGIPEREVRVHVGFCRFKFKLPDIAPLGPPFCEKSDHVEVLLKGHFHLIVQSWKQVSNLGWR